MKITLRIITKNRSRPKNKISNSIDFKAVRTQGPIRQRRSQDKLKYENKIAKKFLVVKKIEEPVRDTI